MAKAKTASKPAPAAADQGPALSVPAPRDAGPAKVNAADLLAMMKGKKKQPASKAKADRPSLELTPEAAELVKVWIPLNIVAKKFESKHKAAQTAMDELLFDIYLDSMWEAKSQPTNPKLVIEENGAVDMEAMFVLTERFKVEMPELADDDDEDAVHAKVVAVFTRVGVNKDKAEQLVTNEMVIQEWKSIPLTELMVGKKVGKEFQPPTASGKSAAEKLIMAIMAGQQLNLTDAEQEALIVSTNWQMTVKGGFLNRVCTYCDTKDQLKSILKLLVKPTLTHRGAKIVAGSTADHNTRLIQAAADVLGSMTDEDEDD